MNRRTFASCSLLPFLPHGELLGKETGRPSEYLLSGNGCGRATGYTEANKILTHQGKTHVAWLDSTSEEGFVVRASTLDRASGRWGETVTIGEAVDNHGGPALTIDGEGYLHIIYGPHHHPMKYRKSTRPNDISEWAPESSFGERLTYPTLLCDPDDTLVFTGRRSYPDRPWEMEMWSKNAGEDWKRKGTLARARYQGYSHFQEGMAWGADGNTLHMLLRFHEKTDKTGYGRIQHMAYMQSPDRGDSWHRADGMPIQLPATAETADVLAAGGKDFNRDLRVGGIAVDPASQLPVVSYSVTEDGIKGNSFLARTNARGEWTTTDLGQFVPAKFEKWNLISPGGLTINAKGDYFLVAQIYLPIPPNRSPWGHPRTEVCLLKSVDGGVTFEFELLTQPDPEVPDWLPNLEKPTGHNLVPLNPGLIFTRGEKGDKNTEILSNAVIWKPLN